MSTKTIIFSTAGVVCAAVLLFFIQKSLSASRDSVASHDRSVSDATSVPGANQLRQHVVVPEKSATWQGVSERRDRLVSAIPTELLDPDSNLPSGANTPPQAAKSEEFLEGKAPQVAEYFKKESSTATEWALAYRDDVCRCESKECFDEVQSDFSQHKPPIQDSSETEEMRVAVRESMDCVRSILEM